MYFLVYMILIALGQSVNTWKYILTKNVHYFISLFNGQSCDELDDWRNMNTIKKSDVWIKIKSFKKMFTWADCELK